MLERQNKKEVSTDTFSLTSLINLNLRMKRKSGL